MRGIIFYGQTGKFTWRMLATVLGGEAICVLLGALVARGITAVGQDGSRSTAYLLVGLGLGALCVVAAGLLRRPYGVTLGWVVHALVLASAAIVPMMLVVGIFFLALWVTCLVQGAKIDAEVARREAAATSDPTPDATPDAGPAGAEPAEPADGDPAPGR